MEEDTVVRLPRPGASVTEDPLLEVLRSGAREMLQQVIEAEVEAFLAAHAELDGPGSILCRTLSLTRLQFRCIRQAGRPNSAIARRSLRNANVPNNADAMRKRRMPSCSAFYCRVVR
jgi:hypothetical protein